MYFRIPIQIYDPITFEATIKYKEVCLEEYIWYIHKLVNDALNRIQDYLPEPKKSYSPLVNGFNGKSYIPLIMTKKNKKIWQQYTQKSINKKLHGKYEVTYGD